MLDKLFGGTAYQAVNRALDAAALRHEVIANNLANINTPGYKRQEVRFEEQLSAALAQGASGSAVTSLPANLKPEVVTVANTSLRADGNNVDPEAENVALATNTLRFEMLAQSTAGYFASLKSVINGR
jgi:flagellar basal-body rod protein FlgB